MRWAGGGRNGRRKDYVLSWQPRSAPDGRIRQPPGPRRDIATRDRVVRAGLAARFAAEGSKDPGPADFCHGVASYVQDRVGGVSIPGVGCFGAQG